MVFKIINIIMVIVSLLWGAGAVASLYGFDFFSKRGQLIKDSIYSTKVFRPDISTITVQGSNGTERLLTSEIPQNERVMISSTSPEIFWYQLQRQIFVPVTYVSQGVGVGITRMGPGLVPLTHGTTMMEPRIVPAGGFLNMSTFASLPFKPTSNVVFVQSCLDISEEKPKTGADIDSLIKSRCPSTSIRPDELYKITQYSGTDNVPVFFMGHRNGDTFIFDKFSRDSQKLLEHETDDKTVTLDLCKSGLFLSASGCIIMGIISALNG
jgi:hypothetical protein